MPPLQHASIDYDAIYRALQRVYGECSAMGQSIDRDGVSYGFALALDGSGGHEDGVSTPG